MSAKVDQTRAQVALVQTRPETILADYERLLRLAGITALPGAEQVQTPTVALEAAPDRQRPAASCPPWQVEGVCRALLADGRSPHDLSVAAPPGTNLTGPVAAAWRRVLAECEVEDHLGAPAAPAPRLLLSGLRTNRWLGIQGPLSTLAAHLLPADQLADLHRHPERLMNFWSEMELDKVAGAVIDATVCGDGPTCHSLTPVAAHVLLAGRDPVAVESVAALLVGAHQARGRGLALPLIKAAGAAHQGCADLDAIELVGDVDLEFPVVELRGIRGFRVSAGGLRGPVRLVEHWDRWTRPWQQRKSRRRYESSPWGRLHATYDQQGALGGGKT